MENQQERISYDLAMQTTVVRVLSVTELQAVVRNS